MQSVTPSSPDKTLSKVDVIFVGGDDVCMRTCYGRRIFDSTKSADQQAITSVFDVNLCFPRGDRIDIGVRDGFDVLEELFNNSESI